MNIGQRIKWYTRSIPGGWNDLLDMWGDYTGNEDEVDRSDSDLSSQADGVA